MTEAFKPFPETNLPIFIKTREDDYLVYAPGFLVRLEGPDWQKSLLCSPEWQTLQSHARKAEETPSSWSGPFTPFSLNVYLTRACNLSCYYCFSDPANANPDHQIASSESILDGAHLVVEHCREQGVPLTFVLNGGGEPTLDHRIESLIRDVKALCVTNEVPLFTYLATNGMISTQRASKMCNLFDLIGLSCDGPPEIQNMQRPSSTGEKSSSFVEHTASIFHQYGQAFEIRVTLTRGSWREMPVIAAYLTEFIQPQAINVELAYCKPNFPIDEREIEEYIQSYFSAKTICLKAGIPWHTNAIRPTHHHRQYCHILQNTLQVIPGDAASLCFLDNDQLESKKRGTCIATYDQDAHNWIIYQSKIDEIRNKLLSDQVICKSCFAASHCHRSCPDICPLIHNNKLPDIHCKLNRRLLDETLESTGNDLASHCSEHHVKIAGKEIIEC